MNNKEIVIIKAVNKFNKSTNVNVNFEEFDDLFLTKLENKKKLKTYKRQEVFNYKLFHEKERERLSRHNKNSDGSNECVIMRSPPRKILYNSSRFSNVDIIKAPSPSSSTVNSSVVSPGVVTEPIVYRSPKKYDTIMVIKSPPIQSPHSVKSLRVFKSPKFISSGMRFSAKSPIPRSPPSSTNSRIELVSPMNNYSRRTNYSKLSSVMSITSKNQSMPFILKKSIKTISSVSSFNSSVMSREEKEDNTAKLNVSIQSFRGKYIANASFKSNVVDSLVHKVNSKASDASSVNEDDEKRELLFKFQLLSNKNPSLVSKYPFTMRSDLKVMKNTYKMIIKQISVNNRVDNLNTYLLAGFMLCEYFFGKIGFDMEGFSKQQIASMKSYESLLIELGEKEYTPYGMENWSVEFRLIATLVFNAFWFIVAKSISKKTNFDIIGFMADKKEEVSTQENVMSPLLNQEKKMKGLRDISSS